MKASIPILNQMIAFKDFILKSDSFDGVKLIAHCNGGERTNIVDTLKNNKFLILIGPEGDFSTSEVELAISHGFLPVTLGDSVLRVETAALMVVTAVYLLRNNK
jgi:16S rRNA (uracil1498-N3)-methyltransferase